MQVIIFDYAIVNMRRSCCDLKRSMDCGHNTAYEEAEWPRSRAIDVTHHYAQHHTCNPERNATPNLSS
ncbi:MAG: hypothetical protein ACOYIF_03995 [Acetivibrionales bacterium]